MRKFVRNTVIAIISLIIAGIYYYIALPAINLHSPGLWWFIIVAVLFVSLFWFLKGFKTKGVPKVYGKNPFRVNENKNWKATKIGFILAGVLVVVYLIGSILSSPIINAGKYQKLLTVQQRDFTEDIKEVDFRTIPLLDRDSATLLGDRKMGGMVDMVSQFEVSDDYTQINYNGIPVRVSPLKYANGIKWLTNQKNGIPAYMRINMATQDTECVMLENGIHYSKSEYFNHNIYRHLRFLYPTYIFDDQIFFEIDDSGTPYWICPVKKYNVGLFGGQTVSRVVICNAITGDCLNYAVSDVPKWVDKVYQAELLMELYDYYGTLKHGFFNSILGQKDCLTTTNGYNYIALDDDVWVYSGVTSVNSDQSNVGFVLMNQRTMETRFYQIEGAIEDSAMSSAEGQVQNLHYTATFPLLLNISNEPTYFIALKDDAGLVKQYAMVNIQKYQWVAIGDTIKECRKAYNSLLATNGINTQVNEENKEISGSVKTIIPVQIDGNTHMYFTLDSSDLIFDADISEDNTLKIIKYGVGDRISLEYTQGEAICVVTDIK